jgi:hypothetical protein
MREDDQSARVGGKTEVAIEDDPCNVDPDG